MMEKDKKLAALIREHGLIHAPEGFTSELLDKIEEAPIKMNYKPLIKPYAVMGFAIVFILLLVIFNQTIPESARDPLFSLPELDIHLPDLSPLFSTGLAAGILGVFFLVLTQAGLRRRV